MNSHNAIFSPQEGDHTRKGSLLGQRYSVDCVVRNQNISPSAVRKIRGDERQKEEQKPVEELKTSLMAQLTTPDPERIVIDDFGDPGPRNIPFTPDVFRVSNKVDRALV